MLGLRPEPETSGLRPQTSDLRHTRSGGWLVQPASCFSMAPRSPSSGPNIQSVVRLLIDCALRILSLSTGSDCASNERPNVGWSRDRKLRPEQREFIAGCSSDESRQSGRDHHIVVVSLDLLHECRKNSTPGDAYLFGNKS